jgi:hypothetical protein
MKFIHINSPENLQQYWQVLYNNYFINLQTESATLYNDWQKIISQQNLFFCLDDNENLLNLATASTCYNRQAKPYWLFNNLLDSNLLANTFLLNEISKILPQDFKITLCVSTKHKNMQQALATNHFWLNHFCFSYE